MMGHARARVCVCVCVCVCVWLDDENRNRKNRTDVFNFFDRVFRHPVSHHRNRRTLEFAILRFRPTFLRI